MAIRHEHRIFCGAPALEKFDLASDLPFLVIKVHDCDVFDRASLATSLGKSMLTEGAEARRTNVPVMDT
jgi:hypothetical protein